MYTLWFRDSAFTSIWYASASRYASRADAINSSIAFSGIRYLDGAYRNVHGVAVLRADLTREQSLERLANLT
jgi:hypothetical protein